MLQDFHNKKIVLYLPSPSFNSIYNLSTKPQVTKNSTPVKTGISGDNSTSFGEVEVANINIPPTIKHAIPVQIQKTILNDRQRLLKKIAFLKLKYYFVSLTALFAYQPLNNKNECITVLVNVNAPIARKTLQKRFHHLTNENLGI